ncbi:hypothetical protein L0F63_000973, partial [Massospora cicadina]
KILLRIKPPPTNRFWIGFYEMPKMSLSIEPMVSDTQIKSTMIIQAIERRIFEMVKEAVVLPNMDDFCFFPSFGTGGIFNFADDHLDSSESENEDDQLSSEEIKQVEVTLPDEIELPEINIIDSSEPQGLDSPVPAAKPLLTGKPTLQPTTFNEKLRNLKESYFGARRQKPPKEGLKNELKNESTSLHIPGHPASLSMPNLLAEVDTKTPPSNFPSPDLVPADPSNSSDQGPMEA